MIDSYKRDGGELHRAHAVESGTLSNWHIEINWGVQMNYDALELALYLSSSLIMITFGVI